MATEGNQLARTHGVWSADVSEEARDIVGVLFDPEQVERFSLVAVTAAEAWLQLRRAERDIGVRGDVVDGKEHPLTGVVNRNRNYLLKVAIEYGLTPRSEASLALERADATRVAGSLDELRRRGRELLDARQAEEAE